MLTQKMDKYDVSSVYFGHPRMCKQKKLISSEPMSKRRHQKAHMILVCVKTTSQQNTLLISGLTIYVAPLGLIVQ